MLRHWGEAPGIPRPELAIFSSTPSFYHPDQDSCYLNVEGHPQLLSFEKLLSFLPQARPGGEQNLCWRRKVIPSQPAPPGPHPSKTWCWWTKRIPALLASLQALKPKGGA